VLTLFFDFPSPASAVALLRLQPIADAGGAVAFAGLDTLGLSISVPPTLDLLAELERVGPRALELGLPLRRPSRQPPTAAAHLIGELADEVGLGASWRDTCLRAYWLDDVDLSDEVVLLELAGRAGLGTEAVAARLADRGARDLSRTRMASARRRGLGGVPVLDVDGVLVSPDLPDADLRQLAGLEA
jgi:2-hydroxychromene-2-carboxylate isomerase